MRDKLGAGGFSSLERERQSPLGNITVFKARGNESVGCGSGDKTALEIEFAVPVSDCVQHGQPEGRTGILFFDLQCHFPQRLLKSRPVQVFMVSRDDSVRPSFCPRPPRLGHFYVLDNFMDFAFQRK